MKVRNVRFVFSTSLSQTVSVGNALGAVITAAQCAISLPAPKLMRRYCALYFSRYADAPPALQCQRKAGECINHENSRNVITQCAFRNIGDILVKYYGNV